MILVPSAVTMRDLPGSAKRGDKVGSGCRIQGATLEGSSTQYLRSVVPKAVKSMVVGTGSLESWALGPAGLAHGALMIGFVNHAEPGLSIGQSCCYTSHSASCC